MIFKLLNYLKLSIDRHQKDYSDEYVKGYNAAISDFRDNVEKEIDCIYFGGPKNEG